MSSIDVECYAGSRGEESPRVLVLDGRRLEIEVVDRWLGPDHRYFKVRARDGSTYLLRHASDADAWELILYERSSLPAHPSMPSTSHRDT